MKVDICIEDVLDEQCLPSGEVNITIHMDPPLTIKNHVKNSGALSVLDHFIKTIKEKGKE